MYRYRDNAGSTQRSLDRLKHLPKLGKLLYVRGYVYFGRYHTHHSAVIVRGENGTARFDGFSWGYGGTGPNGLRRMLTGLGVSPEVVNKVAFATPWEVDGAKEAWKIDLTATPSKES